MFLDRVIHFGETLEDQVKGRSPKKLKLLIEVPNVVHVTVQVLSFNAILHSTPRLVLRLSYPFRRNDGRSGKGSFTDKDRIVN